MKILFLVSLLVAGVVAEADVHKGLLVAKETTKSVQEEDLNPVKRQIGSNFRTFISPSTTYGPPRQAFNNNGPIVEHISYPFNKPIDNNLLELTKPRQSRTQQVIGRTQQLSNPQSVNPQFLNNQQRFINPQSINSQYRSSNQQQGFNNPQQIANIQQQSLTNPQAFNNQEQSFNNAQQITPNPQQTFSNPQQAFNNPQQNFNNPQLSFDNQQQTFNNPQQTFTNAQTFTNPHIFTHPQTFNNHQILNNHQHFNPFSHEQHQFFLNYFNNKHLNGYFGKYTKPCDTHSFHHSRQHFHHNSPDNHFSPNSQDVRHPQVQYSGENQFQGNQDRQLFNGVFNKLQQQEPPFNEFNDNLRNDISQDPRPDFSVVLD